MEEAPIDLAGKRCLACEGGVAPIDQDQIGRYLKGVEGWTYSNGAIAKTYSFKNYHQTMAFINATAWISHRENHHPDIGIGYNTCKVEYRTHAIGGISENDFICAAKVDALFDL